MSDCNPPTLFMCAPSEMEKVISQAVSMANKLRVLNLSGNKFGDTVRSLMSSRQMIEGSQVISGWPVM